MKSYNILKSIAALFIGCFLGSCSSMNSLTISVTEPAPVYLAKEIKSAGIIDRSLSTENNQKMDDMDKYLSAEGKNLDKDGAQASVLALFDELKNNSRFDELKIIDDTDIKSPGMGIFPAPLTWQQVNRICEENDVDALFVLSFYDTDAKVDVGANPVEIAGPLGVKIPAIETQITIRTLIKTGWRIYDPFNEIIQDEYIMHENQVSSGSGINPMNAAQAVIGRKEAVMQVSNTIGHNYAFRILPYRTRVRREYFVKGTENFEVGKRRAQTGNWDGAAELWEKEIANPKGKIAGRAYYNMAIINEINGDLDTAVDWASKSYSDYGIKDALDYLRILKDRIYRNEQLRQQAE